MDTRGMGFNTKLVHAGIPDDPLGSVTTPIYQTSTFAFRNARQGAERFAGTADGFIYTRIGNPTTVALEQNVAQLENGFGATATASGMGAVSTAYMALLGQGDHMVSTAVGLRAVPGAHGKAHGPLRGGIHLHRHHRPGPARAHHPAQHQSGLRGIPVQPGHARDRPAGRGRDRPRQRRPAGGGQHLRQPVPAEAARPGGRRGAAFGDQVPQRPRRRGGRRPGRQDRGALPSSCGPWW